MGKHRKGDNHIKYLSVLQKERFFVDHLRCACRHRHETIISRITPANAIKAGVCERVSELISAELDLARHNVRPDDTTAFVEELCQHNACPTNPAAEIKHNM